MATEPEPLLPDSRRHLVLTALAIGFTVFLVGFVLDAIFLSDSRGILLSDAVTGCLASLMAYVAVHQWQVRQQEHTASLRVVAEVNHHVRNALSAILLSVHIRRDPELLSITETAVNRVDWVLTEVLSSYGKGSGSVTPETLDHWTARKGNSR
jgi:hypothetical protein